jgi:hypothetical protein
VLLLGYGVFGMRLGFGESSMRVQWDVVTCWNCGGNLIPHTVPGRQGINFAGVDVFAHEGDYPQAICRKYFGVFGSEKNLLVKRWAVDMKWAAVATARYGVVELFPWQDNEYYSTRVGQAGVQTAGVGQPAFMRVQLFTIPQWALSDEVFFGIDENSPARYADTAAARVLGGIIRGVDSFTGHVKLNADASLLETAGEVDFKKTALSSPMAPILSFFGDAREPQPQWNWQRV